MRFSLLVVLTLLIAAPVSMADNKPSSTDPTEKIQRSHARQSCELVQ